MKVKLIAEWVGHPAGTILEVNEYFGESLITRGVAEEITKIRPKMQRPIKDKMVQSPVSED